ncbi:UDP-glucose 4-epimerase [Salmonella phage SE4]|uniref:UDP-glucose 4-epimerase n=1 Tax=Salmonella phage SE4 TaxID=2575328 RepID=UPI0011D2CD8A|nr:UDP-glucose 4-epimerase [Salmonella phage SE4]QEG07789.1 UDP-glucose 4-epimerase [Salmonella phage SE4]
MSPVFNQTLTKELQVGDIRKVVTVSSTRPDIEFDTLIAFANLALEDGELSGCEGVSIELNIEGRTAEKPFVGTAAKPQKDPFDEVLVAVFGPVYGKDIRDRLKAADTMAERAAKELREAEKFSNELDHRTGQMLESAFQWFNSKTSRMPLTTQAVDSIHHIGAHEIAKGWAHVQMLQEKIVHMEKNHAEGVELINGYKAQINELQQLMGKRAEEYEAQIRELHGTAVELNRAFDREREALRHEYKKMEEANKKLRNIIDTAAMQAKGL